MVARHCVCSGSSFLDHGSGFHTSQVPERYVPVVLLALITTVDVLGCAMHALLDQIATFCSEGVTAKAVHLLQGHPDGHPGLCQALLPMGPGRSPGSFTGLICSPMSNSVRMRPTGGG